ncbi:MAG: FAD-dependent oxidoreductase, partial [Spirochaetales bacterium]|nr:FAD-dependent oxidoreductase [Spirochaetales bacterium]
MKTYDIILIGTGQATGTILPVLLKKELSVAVIEADRVGGTCVNWGCTPTKTLVASARAAHVAGRGGDFGINIDNYSIDFSKVMERVNGMRVPASEGFEEWLKEVTDFYRAAGSFVDNHTLRVGDDTIRGEKIIIHTGARARKPDIEGIDSVQWLDNRRILALEAPPKHLLVVGGSYIGLEFAQAYRRFGSEVSVLEFGDRIVSREDPDVSAVALKILSDEGIQFHLNAETKKLEKKGADIELSFSKNGSNELLSGSHLLIAVGRVPNTDTLNLSAAGVETNKRGYITVNDEG